MFKSLYYTGIGFAVLAGSVAILIGIGYVVQMILPDEFVVSTWGPFPGVQFLMLTAYGLFGILVVFLFGALIGMMHELGKAFLGRSFRSFDRS